MCWRRPNYETFETWCQSGVRNNTNSTINLSEYLKQNPGDRDEVLQGFREEILRKIRIENQRPALLSFNHDTAEGKTFELDLSTFGEPLDITADTKPHLGRVDTHQLREFQLKAGIIGKVRVHDPRIDLLILENCRIAELEISQGVSVNVRLRNCWIGRLALRESGVGDLLIEGGTVRSLECPSPDQTNPINGDASFPNAKFPTDLKPGLREGAQPYRSLRKHLENLQNVPAANRMRTLELATERHTDRGFNKFWNYVWGCCANYGYSPGRPLWFILVLYLMTALGLWKWDGGDHRLQLL